MNNSINTQLTIQGVSKCVFSDDEWQFEQLHFVRKEWFDKNSKDDQFALKYVQWEKSLDNNAAIEVCFVYETEDGTNYKLIETTCEIFTNCQYIPVNTNKVWKLRELYRIITGKRLI